MEGKLQYVHNAALLATCVLLINQAFVERHEIEHVRAGRNEDDNAVQDQVSGEDDPEGFQVRHELLDHDLLFKLAYMY